MCTDLDDAIDTGIFGETEPLIHRSSTRILLNLISEKHAYRLSGHYLANSTNLGMKLRTNLQENRHGSEYRYVKQGKKKNNQNYLQHREGIQGIDFHPKSDNGSQKKKEGIQQNMDKENQWTSTDRNYLSSLGQPWSSNKDCGDDWASPRMWKARHYQQEWWKRILRNIRRVSDGRQTRQGLVTVY